MGVNDGPGGRRDRLLRPHRRPAELHAEALAVAVEGSDLAALLARGSAPPACPRVQVESTAVELLALVIRVEVERLDLAELLGPALARELLAPAARSSGRS